MQTQNKILDDLARLASSALGIAAEMRSEVEAQFRQQFERILSQMELVSREEFEAVKAMAAKAREEQEVLAERVAALEAKLAAKPKPARASAAPKASASRPAKSKTAKAKTTARKPAGKATEAP